MLPCILVFRRGFFLLIKMEVPEPSVWKQPHPIQLDFIKLAYSIEWVDLKMAIIIISIISEDLSLPNTSTCSFISSVYQFH